ncbi:MAG: DUF4396 domain-containing protein [Myxococcota bacterium]
MAYERSTRAAAGVFQDDDRTIACYEGFSFAIWVLFAHHRAVLDGVLLLWFVLTAGSLAFVVYDSATNTPVSWVQKLAWVLVVFYTGPVGLFFYLLACRSPGPGMHEAFTAAPWKQALNSEMHCLAGDATGIVLAAVVVSFFDLPNGWDIAIEYLSAFVVGLLVFQALMMRSMYGGNYGVAVRKTFFAETVSMNMVMVGMIPVMVILMHYIPEARKPTELGFWWVMGMAAIVGGITAYPINAWLVRNHLKHGCMTLPEGSAEADAASDMKMGDMDMSGAEMGDMDMGEMEMGTISIGRSTTIVLATFAVMLAAAWVTSEFVAPIEFTR